MECRVGRAQDESSIYSAYNCIQGTKIGISSVLYHPIHSSVAVDSEVIQWFKDEDAKHGSHCTFHPESLAILSPSRNNDAKVNP